MTKFFNNISILKKLKIKIESIETMKIYIFYICLIIFVVNLFFLADFKSKYDNESNLCPFIKYKTVYLGDQNRTSYTTIVTTLFIFSINKKRSNSSYYEWSGRMIKSLGAPVVAYIDYSLEEVFTKRFQKSNLTGNLMI